MKIIGISKNIKVTYYNHIVTKSYKFIKFMWIPTTYSLKVIILIRFLENIPFWIFYFGIF